MPGTVLPNVPRPPPLVRGLQSDCVPPHEHRYSSLMNRRITGFHQDAEHHWVADLECGHTQHVRHDPPWQNRPWVLTEESRRARLDSTLYCRLCESQPTAMSSTEKGAPSSIPDPYTDARLQGLCHDGAAELARQLGLPKPKPRL